MRPRGRPPGRQTTDAAHRSLAGTAAQPLYTALDRAGLHTLTDDDHQAVRDLTRTLDPTTLRQVMTWLERTRTTALALSGPEQSSPVRLVVRRRQFRPIAQALGARCPFRCAPQPVTSGWGALLRRRRRCPQPTPARVAP